MLKKTLIVAIFVLLALIGVLTLFNKKEGRTVTKVIKPPQITSSPTPMPNLLKTVPISKIINNNYHIIQTFNNCGPASLSMALSYYGINKTQQELGIDLRPYQVPSGDNDDKSVTLDELAKKAEELGLIAYHRPNGDIELLKQFIANDFPVITRTWLHVNEDIGHYRVVKGYNDARKIIIQDDSYEGANLSFSYSDFNTMWSKFDYEYLVLVTPEEQDIARAIIGDNLNLNTAWQKAVNRNLDLLNENPDDIYSRFNLSVAYYHLKEYKKSVAEYEKVEKQLPFRTLWYQLEPVLAYYELGNYERVFTISDNIFNKYNRAYSELYILRGNIYKKQNDLINARNEYQKAVFYNVNLKSATDAISSIQ